MADAWSVLEGSEKVTLSEAEAVLTYVKSLESDEDMAHLFESKRVWALFHQMEVVDEAEKTEEVLELQSTYLNVVKALMSKSEGLSRLCCSSRLVGRLALALDSPDVTICTQVLELLAVLAVSDGYKSIREAMEYFRVSKEEAMRFESIGAALLSESTPTAFKRDVMLFVNTLVNCAPDIEQRVEIRAELLRAGVGDAIEKLKSSTFKGGEMSEDSYDLDLQLQVFEEVLENDHRHCLATFDDVELRLDDPDALYAAVKSHCEDNDCRPMLLELLQYLIAIPAFDPLGKEHWARILRSAHRAVLGVDDDFALGIEDLKQIATWKETLEARDSKIETSEKKVAKLEAKVKELEKAQETLREQLAKAEAAPKKDGASASSSSPANDPKYAKYFKMLAMHIPRMAVEAKMRAEGLDPAILDNKVEDSKAGGAAAAPAVDPKHEKYFKMLKMHIPRPAVEAKMRAEGIDPSILDGPPPASSSGGGDAAGAAASAGQSNGGPAVKDDPRYAKYFKMLKMHLPRPAVEAKMRAEGVDPKVLDLDPNKPAPSANAAGKVGDDPKYSKYFKMLKLHMPKPAVEAKMRQEGIDPSILSLDPQKPMPADFAAKAAAAAKAAPAKKKEGPKKPNPKPRVPMRSLFWSKIDEREKTVWKNLSDDNIALADDDLDSLEADFAKQKKGGADEKAAAAAEKKEEKKKETNLVDGKVSQNVGIVLHKLKMTNAEIREAIVAVDEDKLDMGKCELLLKSCPSPEDAAAVAEFSGDISTLGRVERFFNEISVVPDVKNRFECMVFKHKLEATCETLDQKLKTVTAACERVSRSEKLAKLLEVVLRIGNYLNGGTSRGGVYGFKLDALAKLGTIKSLDNSKTLMNWVVQWCEDTDPSLVDFQEDFPEIDEAARCSLPQWTADFGQLEAKIKLVANHIAARRKQAPKGDRFVEVMTPFREKAATEAETLSARYQATEQRFGALVHSFGEDPKTCGVEEFFKNLLGEFVASFAKAKQQNDKRKAMEAKAKQREEAAEKRAALKAAGENSENLVNDTFSALKSEAANDILAKLQGPRQRRQASRARQVNGESGALSSVTGSNRGDPSSDRISKFVNRIGGVPQGSSAHSKLEAFRNRQQQRQRDAAAAASGGHAPLPSQPPSNPPPPPTPPPPEETPASVKSIPPSPPRTAPAASPSFAKEQVTDRPSAAPTSVAPPPRGIRRGVSIDNQSELQKLASGDQPLPSSLSASAPPRPPPQSNIGSPATAGPPKPPGSGGGELLKKLHKIQKKKKPPPK